ncbi:hypothetical protein MERGE_000472 [Pneumocystis wakefieldiae]|uniref:Uncharacterized protein n=1 Tax=Pneumocystis wakefieldiae TaxID=38082 RepID=A0A899GBZ0_9ASCO|nr:hypothetical protein MERGE_000472 [Pneumocystis wakefieldiae]
MSCFVFSNQLNDTDLDTLNISKYVSNVEFLCIALKGRFWVNMKELNIDSLKVVFYPLLFSNVWAYNMIPNSINALSEFLFELISKKNTDDNDKRTTRSSSILDCNLRKLNKYNTKDQKAILDTWIE